MFTGVAREGYAKSKLEIESLQQSVSEEMAFDHTEMIDRTAPDGELNPENIQRYNKATMMD